MKENITLFCKRHKFWAQMAKCIAVNEINTKISFGWRTVKNTFTENQNCTYRELHQIHSTKHQHQLQLQFTSITNFCHLLITIIGITFYNFGIKHHNFLGLFRWLVILELYLYSINFTSQGFKETGFILWKHERLHFEFHLIS